MFINTVKQTDVSCSPPSFQTIADTDSTRKARHTSWSVATGYTLRSLQLLDYAVSDLEAQAPVIIAVTPQVLLPFHSSVTVTGSPFAQGGACSALFLDGSVSTSCSAVSAVEIVVTLNAFMGLPPVVVGLVVYLLLSRAGPLGDLGILFTPAAMILAQTVLVLPIIAALTRQAIEDAWREYEEQLRSLGVTPGHAALTLLWDCRFSLLTAILAGFGRAIAEVGAVMMVGGNIDSVTRVMTTAIALETSKGDLPLALGLGAILLLLVLALNALVLTIRDFAERRYG